MTKSITFDDESKRVILEFFDKTVDEVGFIIEKSNPKQRVLSPEGEEIHLVEWAGIAKGSQVFVKSDIVSLIKFSKRERLI